MTSRPHTRKTSAVPASTRSAHLVLHYRPQVMPSPAEALFVWCWGPWKRELDLPELRRDDFGIVFEIPIRGLRRAQRLGFKFKVGPGTDATWLEFDRTWTLADGWEVWTVAGNGELFPSALKAMSPALFAAWLDDYDRLEVQFLAPTNGLDEAVRWRLDGPGRVTGCTPLAPHRVRLSLEGLDLSRATTIHFRGTSGDAQAPLFPRGIDRRWVVADPLGAHVGQGQTTFRLFAPRARSASVALYPSASAPMTRSLPLTRRSDGAWECVVPHDLEGTWYTWHVDGPSGQGDHFDPRRPLVDPWAHIALSSRQEGRGRAMVFSPSRLRVRPLAAPPPLTDLVIYEAHIRDLVGHPSGGHRRSLPGHRGYLSWTRAGLRGPGGVATGLDHLVELGVGAVQLLPVHEYPWEEGTYHWGYEPLAWSSPAGIYATRAEGPERAFELAALIDALHARGIAVILDVVFNHTVEGDETGPVLSFKGLDGRYFYRQHPGTLTLSNGSGCGNELATERPVVRATLIQCLKMWVEHYKVDGFRFDLMGLLDPGTLRAIREALPPHVYLYGEPWAAGPSLWGKQDLEFMPGIAAFNDNYRDAVKGSPEGPWGGFVQGAGSRRELVAALSAHTRALGGAHAWAASPSSSLTYTTCHDNLSLADKLEVSVPGMDEAEKIARVELTFFVQLLSLGPVLIHGGEELLRSKPFRAGHDGRPNRDADGPHQFDANAYRAPDAVNNFDWSLKERYLRVVQFVQGLIAVRKGPLGAALRIGHAPAPTYLRVYEDPNAPHAIGWEWNSDRSLNAPRLRAFANADRERGASFSPGGSGVWRRIAAPGRVDPDGWGVGPAPRPRVDLRPLEVALFVEV